jgi:hypothetical protein
MAMGDCISSMSSQVECLERLEKGLELLESARPGLPGPRVLAEDVFSSFCGDVPVLLDVSRYFVVIFFCGVFKIFQIYSGIANSIAIEHDKSISPWQAIYKNGYVMICSIAMQDKLPGGSDAISYQISLGHSDPTWSNSHPRTVSR